MNPRARDSRTGLAALAAVLLLGACAGPGEAAPGTSAPALSAPAPAAPAPSASAPLPAAAATPPGTLLTADFGAGTVTFV
ncbi:hypothetical protein ABT106_30780, partial [Streptomyces sp. NPDC002044]